MEQLVVRSRELLNTGTATCDFERDDNQRSYMMIRGIVNVHTHHVAYLVCLVQTDWRVVGTYFPQASVETLLRKT